MRMAGAGSLRATRRRICCSRVSRRPRKSGCSPRLPTRYGDGGGSAWYGGYAMVRRGIVLGHCAEHSRRAGPGGGVLCRQARVHDCGRALPVHPSGVAVPLAPLLGCAGPGSPLEGGGGGGRPRVPWGPVAPLRPLPPRPYRACRRPPRPVLPRLVRATGLAAPQPAPSVYPPPFAPSLPRGGWGGWQPGRPGEGRLGGAGGLPPCGRAMPEARLSRSPHPPSAPPPSSRPPVARAGRCPHVAGPEGLLQRHTQAAQRAQVGALAASRMLSAAPCVGAAVRPRRRWTAHPGAGSDWASRVLVDRPKGPAGQGGEGCAGAGASPPGGAR